MFLTIIRGDSFSTTFLVLSDGDPLDLGTVSLARFTVKEKVADADSAALVRLSTGVGGVTILTQSGDTLGMLTVSLTPTETAALTPTVQNAIWDLQLTLNDGSVHTPFMGEAEITGDVTINSADVGTDT